VKKNFPVARVCASIVLGFTLISCAGVSFVKEGEQEAKASCSSLNEMQDEDMSVNAGLMALGLASANANSAAAANDDYRDLAQGMRAFLDIMTSVDPSMAAAQVAWDNVAQLCNEL